MGNRTTDRANDVQSQIGAARERVVDAQIDVELARHTSGVASADYREAAQKLSAAMAEFLRLLAER